MAVLEMEGTWEEILKRSAELSGQRVKVTVLTARPAPTSSASMNQAVEKWLEQVERSPLISGTPRQGQEAEIQDAVVEKFRKQGLKI